ncbi:hypothetical protein CR513_34747, partial [Mucuna pruriens]
MMDRSMIDAGSGGALMDKKPATVRHLISNMVSNTQQFGIKEADPSRKVNKVSAIDNLRLENQLTELTSLVRQLVVGQHQPSIVARICGICTFMEHPINMWPTLQETESDHPESVGAIGGYQYKKQSYQSRQFDNQQSRRQQFWPNSSQGSYVAQRFGFAPGVPPNKGNFPSLEDLMKQLATSKLEFQQSMNSSNMQFQQNMSVTIQDLKTQATKNQLINHHQLAGSKNLPSQTILNPRGNVSVVSLRSGRELQVVSQQGPRPTDADIKPDADSKDKSISLSFPTRTLSTKKPEYDEKLLKMFRKVEINIPLLDTIKQIPKYTKFLKELCVHKRKNMKGGVELGGIVSTLTRNDDIIVGSQQVLPKKCRDPEIFSITCTIGNYNFVDAMLDLGASISFMPTSIYKYLNFGDLKPTMMTIQLANRSVIQPMGVLEDVPVQVNELTFPADFYVLDMEDETSEKGSTLILGRPFFYDCENKD